eukprot:CAMPEP_0206426986 /NCGR_PEP_ID=MMETSP0324_2-20121206/4745_1 /ASSEMBLY_ACC=CAM_ASM_000836 /TAXON_ID=2866 /ORGANISM="Crypthecodinium cohnii, Strain Seligo" /LENGTH=49 /DNA_ID=CAMNT_0053892127 /DNA_START=421 /DNA_END=570 /DNA_ORIENTATION=-
MIRVYEAEVAEQAQELTYQTPSEFSPVRVDGFDSIVHPVPLRRVDLVES